MTKDEKFIESRLIDVLKEPVVILEMIYDQQECLTDAKQLRWNQAYASLLNAASADLTLQPTSQVLSKVWQKAMLQVLKRSIDDTATTPAANIPQTQPDHHYQLEAVQLSHGLAAVVVHKHPQDTMGPPRSAAIDQAADSDDALAFRYSIVADYAWGWEIWEDAAGELQYVSPDCAAVSGYSADAFLQNSDLFTELIYDEDKVIWEAHRHEASTQLGVHDTEFRIHRADGQIRWLAHHCRPVLDSDGQFLGFRSYNEDITERKEMEQELRRSEERYRWIMESTSDILWVYDIDRESFSFVSPSVQRVRGISRRQALRETWADAVAEPFRHRLQATIEQGLTEFLDNDASDGQFILELQQPCENSELLWVELAARFRRGQHGRVELVGSTRSIAERKDAEQQMQKLIFRDDLTRLYNRRYFDEQMQRMDHRFNLPASILIGDINGLKLVNDAFGHDRGDELLRLTGTILMESARPQDVVARTSGDEFCILMPKTDRQAARRVLKAIEDRIKSEQDGIFKDFRYVTWSFGVGTKTSEHEPLVEAKQLATKEMERRKLMEKASAQYASIASLKAALFARSEETEAHCQRMADMAGKVGIELGLPPEQQGDLHLLCQLHDIGKIGIDDSILKKPGKLTPDEWARMQEHPAIGARIAAALPEITSIAQAIEAHHERWDGLGYPNGLQGTDIPILARILAVIDAFDAMTHQRIYRNALREDQAVNELVKNSGTQFDPAVVAVFLQDVLFYDPQQTLQGKKQDRNA